MIYVYGAALGVGLDFSIREKPGNTRSLDDVMLLPLVSSGIVLIVLWNMLVHPAFFFLSVLPHLIVLMVVRNMPVLFYALQSDDLSALAAERTEVRDLSGA